MAIRVGILTSGGDCPGLNATLRGVAKALYHRMGDKVEIVGIMNGYDGLINGNFRHSDRGRHHSGHQAHPVQKNARGRGG